MAETQPSAGAALGSRRAERDARIDVLRGAALFMIFADHIPSNVLASVTLHNFALCDAAEVFVLLAGVSAALAYGAAVERDGWASALRRVARRCWQIYVAQVILFLATLIIGQLWLRHFHLTPTVFAPIMRAPLKGVILGFLLAAQPDYLNILPLYVVLLAAFPLIWLVLRRNMALAVLGSISVWLLAAHFPVLNLPNWTTHEGWYFDPFSWQLLLTIGVALACLATRNGGDLPWHPVLAGAAAGFLLITLLQSEAWHDLGMPESWSLALDGSDKTHLGWPRVLSVLALAYLVFASGRLRALSDRPLLRPLQRCGRHSLEVFVTGCLFALFARLLFRVTGHGPVMQLLVNTAGMSAMIVAARWADMIKRAGRGTPAWVAS